MTRFAPLLRPVPTATALAVLGSTWLAWAPMASAAGTEAGSVADLVAQTSPAVVTVLVTKQEDQQMAGMPEGMSPFPPGSPFDEFFRQFGMPNMPNGGPSQPEPHRGPDGMALGSGFIIDHDGYIVTNNHVVEESESVKVRLSDDREFTAKVLGTDPQTDLALIKIEAHDLPELPLGDSEKVRVGDDVIAVGNPFGLGGTVTRGIVSAMARDINAGPYVDFIQTDAAINRGNSGGPLLNLEGEVIGVNSAIYSPNGGSVGVGFAIPSDTVKEVVADLREEGSVERGWLGVSIQNVTPEIATAIGLDDPHGALVADVVEDGPAAGHLRTGDVILSFDGKRVESSRELPKLVAATTPDADVKVEVLRQGEEQTLTFRLGKLDQDRMASAEPGAEQKSGTASEELGATLAAVTPAAREQLGLPEDEDGVVITSLDGAGKAAQAGLAVGDVILQVGDKAVRTPSDVDHALSKAKTHAVLFQIAREGARIFVGVSLT